MITIITKKHQSIFYFEKKNKNNKLEKVKVEETTLSLVLLIDVRELGVI
jgi:hypothetical protein